MKFHFKGNRVHRGMKCGGGWNANNAQVVQINTADAKKRGRALIIKLQWLRAETRSHSNGSACVFFGNTLPSERNTRGIFCCNWIPPLGAPRKTMGSARTLIPPRSLNYSLSPQQSGAGCVKKNSELLTAAPSAFNAERKLGVVGIRAGRVSRWRGSIWRCNIILFFSSLTQHRQPEREREDGVSSFSALFVA